MGKKVVRTTGLQISTPTTSKLIEDYYTESKTIEVVNYHDMIHRDTITKLE